MAGCRRQAETRHIALDHNIGWNNRLRGAASSYIGRNYGTIKKVWWPVITQFSHPSQSKGLIKRNFFTHPQGYLGKVAEPFNMPLIDESEIDDRIREQEVQQSSLQHIRDQGNYGQRIPALDQNGQGYCWAYSTTSAVTLLRAFNNQPYKRLSGHMLGCLIKGYRDQGGWNGESLKFASQGGIATTDTWKEKSMSKSNDTPAMRQDAANQTVQEWWDLAEDSSTVKRQLATTLLLNIPTMVDFNWWSHSVCAVRLLAYKPVFKIRIWNSWTDSWEDAGMGDLEGNHAIPNGAACPRVVRAAA